MYLVLRVVCFILGGTGNNNENYVLILLQFVLAIDMLYQRKLIFVKTGVN